MSSLENLVVVPAIPDDVPQIQDILYLTWLSTYPNEALGITTDDIHEHFRSRHDPEIIQKRREIIVHPEAGMIKLVARADFVTVGVAFLTVGSPQNELRVLYVLPEMQGKKVGRALWDRMQYYLNPKSVTVLTVAPYNRRAISFYEKRGFVETGFQLPGDEFVFKNGKRLPGMFMTCPALTDRES